MLRAADLPAGMKQKLLDQIRRQMGEEAYEQTSSHLGEDVLLDYYLQKTAKERKGGFLSKVVTGLVSYWYVWLPSLLGVIAEHDNGCAEAIALVWLVGWILYMLGKRIGTNQ